MVADLNNKYRLKIIILKHISSCYEGGVPDTIQGSGETLRVPVLHDRELPSAASAVVKCEGDFSHLVMLDRSVLGPINSN